VSWTYPPVAVAFPVSEIPGEPFLHDPTVVFRAKTEPFTVTDPVRLAFPATPTCAFAVCFVCAYEPWLESKLSVKALPDTDSAPQPVPVVYAAKSSGPSGYAAARRKLAFNRRTANKSNGEVPWQSNCGRRPTGKRRFPQCRICGGRLPLNIRRYSQRPEIVIFLTLGEVPTVSRRVASVKGEKESVKAK
jgi:hypothetical protein